MKRINWDFNIKVDYRIYLVKTIFCKYPKMTALYKELKQKYKNRQIDFFYVEESLPF